MVAFPSDRFIAIKLVNFTNLSNLLEGLEIWRKIGLIPKIQTNINLTSGKFHKNNTVDLEISTNISLDSLILGLKSWLNQGLLSQTQINLSLRINANNPAFLQGLDSWLRLGILCEIEVKQLCQTHLISPITVPRVVTNVAFSRIADQSPQIKAKPPLKKGSSLADMMQSLMAELSVIWLLLLGVFLVVISSGVLAASQWEKFPAVGQYGILWLYTLGFGVASWWTRKKPNLRLTTSALRIVALLLVPINFLAMDSFPLWNSSLGWLVMGVAAISLTFLTTKLFEAQIKADNSYLALFNHLGLSYIHLGWTIPHLPLFITYLGIIGTALGEVKKQKRSDIASVKEPKKSPAKPAKSKKGLGDSILNAELIIVVYSLAILLIRAIFMARVSVLDLGLAIGICGWLVAWRSPPHIILWQRLGGSLLFLGWLLSLPFNPKQAIAVSILALVYLARKLHQNWLSRDLLIILLIVLQLHWLVERVLPFEPIIGWMIQVTETYDTPWSLLGLGLFPYLIFILKLKDWFSKLSKDNLVEFSNKIAILLGLFLTSISLFSPLLTTLNLAGSALTLSKITQPSDQKLGALTHICILLTMISGINLLFPGLNIGIWGTILLIFMALEGYFDLIYLKSHSLLSLWGKSAWGLSLILGGLSYSCFWVNTPWVNLPKIHAIYNLIWFLAPLILTVIGINNRARKKISIGLSITFLGFLQTLTLGFSETRLLGLAVATGLMFINTFYLRHWLAATITVGFSLSSIIAILETFELSLVEWLLVGTILSTFLWILYDLLQQKDEKKEKLLGYYYALGIDIWGFLLSSLVLWSLTWHSWAVYNQFISPSLTAIAASTLLLGNIIYRSWQNPTNWTIYGIGWSLELLTIETLGMTGRSIIALIIANIGLGLLTQMVGEWWLNEVRSQKSEVRSYFCNRVDQPLGKTQFLNSWHILPLLYGGIGTALRWNFFSSWTGLASLGLALIVIGIGRRREKFKPLLYLAIAGLSWSVYELLLYQIFDWPMGDRLLAMGTLATSIMYIYRLFSPWLTTYLRFSTTELIRVAHLHWLLGTGFLISAIFFPVTFNQLIGLGTGIFLTRYAIMQGRIDEVRSQKSEVRSSFFNGDLSHTPETFRLKRPGFRTNFSDNPNQVIAELWVYLGLVQAIAIVLYTSLILPNTHPILSNILELYLGSLIAIISLFIGGLPWQKWGWPNSPWQVLSLLLPLIGVATTINGITFLVAALCYVILSKIRHKRRCLYLSLILINIACFYWMFQLRIVNYFLYFCLIGSSILTIIWIEPYCQTREGKQLRHYLRIFGSSIIGFSALILYSNTGILPSILSIIGIFMGLALRIRGFLFVGTIIFIMNVFYQLVILSLSYPLLKWIVGLLVGLIFIWVAGNFETRKTQLNSLIRHWISEFEEWE
ncbi:MAG TPA: hypothetical protein DCF68_14195 [Cyanothece sp. UBA12306]|nr:hypothetical protein [Cyanothece sp. UBA12306]